MTRGVRDLSSKSGTKSIDVRLRISEFTLLLGSYIPEQKRKPLLATGQTRLGRRHNGRNLVNNLVFHLQLWGISSYPAVGQLLVAAWTPTRVHEACRSELLKQ